LKRGESEFPGRRETWLLQEKMTRDWGEKGECTRLLNQTRDEGRGRKKESRDFICAIGPVRWKKKRAGKKKKGATRVKGKKKEKTGFLKQKKWKKSCEKKIIKQCNTKKKKIEKRGEKKNRKDSGKPCN